MSTFGRVRTPCGDCLGNLCTMNCGGRDTLPVFNATNAMPGDRIEFLSDVMTDKGPATATLAQWHGRHRVQVSFGGRTDEQQFFDAEDIEARLVGFNRNTAHGTRLWQVR